MGLFDIFRPKYKNSDWKVRLEAVKELDDQKKLTEIAINDKNSNVCKEAIKKITDQSALIEIAKSKSGYLVIKSVLKSNHSKNYLPIIEDIAKNAKDSNVRKEAIKKITYQEVLRYIAQNGENSSVEKQAAEKYNEILKDIAQNDENFSVRLRAVEKIKKQDILKDIAQNNDNWQVRLGAVKNSSLKDQKILVDIAKNNTEQIVRKEAIKKITDWKELKYIAQHETYYEARNIALDKLPQKDRKKILSKLSKEDNFLYKSHKKPDKPRLTLEELEQKYKDGDESSYIYTNNIEFRRHAQKMKHLASELVSKYTHAGNSDKAKYYEKQYQRWKMFADR